jgi:uncharacterized protein YcbK (DUF882 family)
MTNVTTARPGNASLAWSFLCRRSSGSRADRIGGAVGSVALLFAVVVPSQTQNAVANGDTRTLNLYHSHTGESINATFRVNGVYDSAVLEKLNWFLRDWRNNDTTRMDPRLFDVVWEVYRTAGTTDPIVIYSAYRSPATNAMLRRRSSGVAEYSQHMIGKAMDTTMPGMSMERIREIGMRLQRGGVGYYPGSNFVHLDVGNVRSWPRMNYDQLVRLFPDGKTVHLASNGQALPRYEEARAELGARGNTSVAMALPKANGFFGWLFGGGRDAVEDAEPAPRIVTARRGRDERRTGRMREPVVTVASVEPRNASDVPNQAATNSPAGFVPAPLARPALEQNAKVESDTTREQVSRRNSDLAKMPLPPLRPQDNSVIARVFVDVPEPPRRPEKSVRVASLGDAPAVSSGVDLGGVAKVRSSNPAVAGSAPAESISRAAILPVVITRGLNDRANVPDQVLAYAPTPRFAELQTETPDELPRAVARKPVPPPQTPTVPGRLDRSNFRSLTGNVATASLVTQSLLGPSVAGLRQAARVTSDILSPIPSIGYVATFGTAASDLDTSNFTGAATKPLTAAPGLVRIMESQLQHATNMVAGNKFQASR